MCKLHFFLFCGIFFFVISSCGISEDMTKYGIDTHSNRNSKKGNLTSINYKRGKLKSNSQFAQKESSNSSGKRQLIKDSRKKSGPSFNSYKATKGKLIYAPSSIKKFSYRERNLSDFKRESSSKKFSSSFGAYKNKRVKEKDIKPIKRFNYSNKNLRLLKKDVRKKTKYGSGRPSIHGKKSRKNNEGNLKPKTYKKADEKFLFIFPQKKAMHKYETIQKPKKKRSINFWSNPFYKEKRKSDRTLKKLNKKKRKPEMELFDPKAKIL